MTEYVYGINNIYISTTNINVDINMVNISADIISETISSVKCIIGGNEIPGVINTNKLSVDIPSSNFIVGDNIIELYNVNDLLFRYNIIKEDRDTFKIIRDLRYDISHNKNITGDVIYKSGFGYGLTEIGSGDIKVNIPTIGKSNIQNIIITSDDDTIEIIQNHNSLNLVEFDDITKHAMFRQVVDLSGVDNMVRIMNKRRF